MKMDSEERFLLIALVVVVLLNVIGVLVGFIDLATLTVSAVGGAAGGALVSLIQRRG